jgi:antibiotic biosynthesis monooxygenase (ABM) superfamily enzyme
MYVASILCSSLFFSTQTSLPNFKAALAVILSIFNFVSLVTYFSKCLYNAIYFLCMCVTCLLNNFCSPMYGILDVYDNFSLFMSFTQIAM